MRNLKRVLSLALALVMVLGMMVITTSAAAYTDAEEITYTEAVEVMSALGILNGNPDGTFAPKGTLTREQAAKILAFVTMGAEADEYLTGSAAPFDDVAATKWSAKYIAYCKNLGIINGVGDNKFNPAGTLKVVEFAKMLLVAAGIDGEYTGSNWANNVKNAVAKTEMKNTGIKITNAEITREEACALALAAMKSGSTSTTYYYVVPAAATTTAVNYGKFESVTEAYVLANVMNQTSTTAKVLIDVDTSGTLLKDVHKVTYKAVDTDAYGNPGVGYEKTVQGKKVIDLFYGEEAALTYTKNMNTVAGKKAIAADLKALDVTVDTTDGNRFSETSVTVIDGTTGVNLRKVDSLAAKTGENAVVKVYVEDGEVTLITVVNTYATTVASVTEAEGETPAYVTLANTKTFNTEAFAEDDVVLYTLSGSDVETLVKAESVTGTLTSYTQSGKYTIGDKVYEVSGIALAGTEAAVIAAMGEEMVYSLDANGKIVAVAEPEGAVVVDPVITDYAMVLSANGTVKTTTISWPTESITYEVAAQLMVLLATGEVEIWDLEILKADKAITGTDIAKGDYYYMLGKTPVEVAFSGENDTDRSSSLTADIVADFSGIYTYADKALVARVVTYTGTETKDATIQLSNGTDLDNGVYTFGSKDVILNDKTVFVLQAADPDDGYVVKTGVAALEDTVISDAFKAVVAVTAGKDENGDPDTSKNVYVANVIFAETTAFVADTSVSTTDEYALVNGDYTVTVSGTDTYHTYGVVYADGSEGSVVIKVTDGYEALATGAYLLKADGSIDNDAETRVTETKTVKLVSGTTVIFEGGSAMTTNAKTVVVGGELAAEAEAYVVGTGSIVIAFIVE